MSRGTILFLVTTFNMGGAERVYVQLAQGLAKRGYRVIAVCLQRRSGHVQHELIGSAIETVDLRMSSRFDIGVLWRLICLLRRHHVDVVYTFLIHSHIIGRIAARLCRVPVVISSQQVMLIENWFQTWANRLTARWCDAIVAVSENVAAYLTGYVRVPPSKVRVIYNAVDARQFGHIEPKGAPASAPGPYVGYCAWLRPEKDHKGLILAVKRMKSQFPGIRLLLAGDGPERERLARFVESEQMGDCVEMLGHVSCVSAFYARIDMYVQSSYFEGLPLAILEAQASGLPVVATRVAGNEEIIEHGKNGLLVAPRDPAALADAMTWMLTHRDEARQMGNYGRQIVRDRFGAEAMVAATDDLIVALGGARRNTRSGENVQYW